MKTDNVNEDAFNDGSFENDRQGAFLLASLLSAPLSINNKTFETIQSMSVKNNTQKKRRSLQRKSNTLFKLAPSFKADVVFEQWDFLTPMHFKWENAVNVFRKIGISHHDR